MEPFYRLWMILTGTVIFELVWNSDLESRISIRDSRYSNFLLNHSNRTVVEYAKLGSCPNAI